MKNAWNESRTGYDLKSPRMLLFHLPCTDDAVGCGALEMTAQ